MPYASDYGPERQESEMEVCNVFLKRATLSRYGDSRGITRSVLSVNS